MKCNICNNKINNNSIINITKTKCGCIYHSDCFLKQFATIYKNEDNSKCLRCNNSLFDDNKDLYLGDNTVKKMNKFKNLNKFNNFKIVIEC